MRLLFRFALVCVACFLLASCGVKTKSPTVTDQMTAAEAELHRQTVVEMREANIRKYYPVAHRIRVENVELCGEKVGYSSGFKAANLPLFKEEWRSAEAKVRGLDDRWRITYIFEGGAAEKAGLAVGDVIKSVDGVAIPEGEDALKTHSDAMNMVDLSLPYEIVYERNGEVHTTRVKPQRICKADLVVVSDDIINAYASESTVYVTAGLLRFIENDDELAVIVGHEFGHFAMLHNEDRKKRAAAGMVADVLLAVLTGVSSNIFSSTGANMYNMESEFEADYVGAYMACRAGFDPTVAPGLWRRMSASNAPYIDKDSTSHPSNAERGARLKEIMAEIDGKQKQGEAIVPNFEE